MFMLNARRTDQSSQSRAALGAALVYIHVSDLKTVPVVYYIAYVNGEISQLNHH